MYKRIGDYKIGFSYVFSNNKPIVSTKIIEYIKSLKIPPAYLNVSISKNPKSKILAFGFDSKGRKQVIYNKDFINNQAIEKFKRYMKLRKSMKKLKEEVDKDINGEDIKKKEIAMIILLIINCGFRIGNAKYLKENNSYGLTTLEYKHLTFQDNKIHIEFIGKKGVVNNSICDDQIIYDYLIKNKDNNKVFSCSSSDVNNYLKELNPNITSKDLRTWNANELFLKFMKRKNMTPVEAIKKVAEKLHNTPAVCKKNYLNPELLDKYKK